MAYNIAERFSPPPKSFTLLDPGAYNLESPSKIPNKAPFLSNTQRKTTPCGRIWTDKIYDAGLPPKIPNCTSLMSKCPRFPYEALSKQDLEDILCRCGIQTVCECPPEEIVPEFVCQGKVPRRFFKGHPPRSPMGGGLSAPSRGDQGFKVNIDGSQQRVKSKISKESPPFYDIRVDESTAFYQGCKWSRWTSKRSSKGLERSPGPADYTINREPTYGELCAEAVRSHNRKRSKQLRFIEMVQQRNIIEGRPGPATYTPKEPTCSSLQFLGDKAKRFPKSSEQLPGPADHWITRDFDLPTQPERHCLARLPEPPFFGVKAQRFKPRKEEGASPATYSPCFKECFVTHCPTAPFGSSSKRFKQEPVEEDEDESEDVAGEKDDAARGIDVCTLPTSEFKSKTIRFKPLKKMWNEQSPADLPQSIIKVERRRQLQYTAPFFSSEGRFQPWNDWLPVFNRYETPGPCYYKLEKPRCYPAVSQGPLFRTRRFPAPNFTTPAPNEYKVGGGVETVLDTYNQKLRDNMENQHKFHFDPPIEPRKLSFKERESLLIAKCIALLDDDTVDANPPSDTIKQDKPKMLRCFLYNKPTLNV